MQPFSTVTGVAAPMPSANIDTDVIMPKQFLKGVDRGGLRDGTFHGLRFDPTGGERPDFVLNRAGWRDAKFLVVGPNFGCGSSREHAVWGLGQLGIRGLIGTSFAGIFFDNCVRNGLLAVTLDAEVVTYLSRLATDPATAVLAVDLPGQSIVTSDGQSFPFAVDPGQKEALVLGLDAIGSTLKHREEILSFEQTHLRQNPWLA